MARAALATALASVVLAVDGDEALELANAKARIAELEKEVQGLRAVLPSTTSAAPTRLVKGVAVKELQYEETILAGVCFVLLVVWALPLVRPFKHCCETRLHKVYPVLTVLSFLAIAATINQLYMIEVNDVFFALVRCLEAALDMMQKGLLGLAGLAGLAVIWKFKDRLFQFLGVENPAHVIGEFRDWATCWSMKRFHAIEVFVWKVEGLPSARLHSSNDVFIEVTMGYNVTMRTRVHHRAGHACVLKESLQLNFDPYDSEHKLTIAIMNQEVLGSAEIASLQLGAEQVRRLEELPAQSPAGTTTAERSLGFGSKADFSAWAPSQFHCLDLVPAGKLYLRFAPVDSEA
eukprot:TRINITY_DN24834_c0_g1_i1.p1 TRINITY_DN24834_c0_g1~~TRINITY_DN24834_c0_g1_i1.p1  ORF type:complete len:361 (+),score=64.78 TRINITY_DN24834_c0_g1_i1:42-1085(+)